MLKMWEELQCGRHLLARYVSVIQADICILVWCLKMCSVLLAVFLEEGYV